MDERTARAGATLCAVWCLAGAAGCSTSPAPLTEQQKKNWAGSAPPPGFEKEMAKHNREWQERDAKARAKLGESAAAPAGAKL